MIILGFYSLNNLCIFSSSNFHANVNIIKINNYYNNNDNINNININITNINK